MDACDLPDRSEDELAGDEIEAAYQRALEASQDLELDGDDSELTGPPDGGGEPADVAPSDAADGSGDPPLPTADAHSATSGSQAAIPPAEAASGPASAEDDGGAPRVQPAQVIEAALFVGGSPLTARKLCGLLRGSFEVEFIERTVAELNARYAEQARPYVIRLGSAGYRLELRPEYERYRHRVYGTGPREVKLSQEVLELLAVIAYKQPVSQETLDALGRKGVSSLLRQLLRRELIGLTRGDGGPKDVTYHTTPRFLQLFGLASLDDLPRTDDVALK